MDIAGMAGGGALGAAFGALGSVLNRGFGLLETREKRKDRQLELAHEKERWSHESALADQARSARAEEARQALAQAQVQGCWTGLAASVEAEGAIPGSWPWVNAVRALTRPALTVMLWLLYALLFLCAAAGALEASVAASVVDSAIGTISFSAATALTWWFGDRAPRGR
ncbi:MAG TPA: hypothetical protein VF138_07480 [Caulobacteraceae bacterium]